MTESLVLFRGQRCPYGRAFQAVFAEHAAAHLETPHAERVLDEKDAPAWERDAIQMSPTVVRFADGVETRRLEGKPFIGITRQAFRRWLAG